LEKWECQYAPHDRIDKPLGGDYPLSEILGGAIVRKFVMVQMILFLLTATACYTASHYDNKGKHKKSKTILVLQEVVDGDE
jgi:hypothetical protein